MIVGGHFTQFPFLEMKAILVEIWTFGVGLLA